MSAMETPPLDSQDFRDSELHRLLARSLEHREDLVKNANVIPAKLAKEIGFCRYTVYRWLGSNRISPKGARKIIAISAGRLSREDFAPFLIL